MACESVHATLTARLKDAMAALAPTLPTPPDAFPEPRVEQPKHPEHGHYATGVAMVWSKACRLAPRDLAERLVQVLQAEDEACFESLDVAGPGFINMRLRPEFWAACVVSWLERPAPLTLAVGQGGKVHLEFVSANPTGPLHVGHGRGAAMGSMLASLLKRCGYDVHTEYYINDAGRQMGILGLSVWLRFLEQHGVSLEFPENAYQGAYITVLARDVLEQAPEQRAACLPTDASLAATVERWGAACHGAPDVASAQTPDALLDRWVALMKKVLGDVVWQAWVTYASDQVLHTIQDDLAAFGVTFDAWFSERKLVERGALQAMLDALEARGATFVDDGACWFRASAYGDEKDRVLVRQNGEPTYFATDAAYHWHKVNQGYDVVIDVMGADHHGYVPRLRAMLAAMGLHDARFETHLVQFASLVDDGEPVAMSTRRGQFVTLRDLVEDVGRDAARFFYARRRMDQHIEFDRSLAKKQSQDNPVYYVQYAHARICRVFDQARSRGFEVPEGSMNVEALLPVLRDRASDPLLVALADYVPTLIQAAKQRAVHLVPLYLMTLASALHTFYNARPLLVDNPAERNAALGLLRAVQQVLADGCGLLGLDAPMSM